MYRHRYNKYHNKKVELDGFTFDSIAESQRYGELKLLQMAGEISDLRLQTEFLVFDGFKHRGKKYQAIHYTDDFDYIENGVMVVEDVKSPGSKMARDFGIRVKLLLKRYPEIDFRIIMRGRQRVSRRKKRYE